MNGIYTKGGKLFSDKKEGRFTVEGASYIIKSEFTNEKLNGQ